MRNNIKILSFRFVILNPDEMMRYLKTNYLYTFIFSFYRQITLTTLNIVYDQYNTILRKWIDIRVVYGTILQ